MAIKTLHFPKGFLWGTATAAHQIEGGNKNNDWWLFEKQPGRIKTGDSSEIACDHWNRYKEDFALITRLKNNAYRMSIEWSRVFPEPGRVDRAALDHYHRMIDELLRRKITPFVTLLHFTIPIWWMRRGGLLNQSPEHLDHFRQFCELIGTEFRKKIKFWNTINEIDILITGYLSDEMPPTGNSFFKAIRAENTLFKMHAIAYHTVKKTNPSARVGVVHNMLMVRPYRPRSLADRLLASFADHLFNGSLFRALKTGRLFAGLRAHTGLKNSSDFIGLNYYNFLLVSHRLPGLVASANENPLCGKERLCAGIGWEPYPEGFLESMRRIKRELPGTPIYITENGIGTDDDAWRSKCLIDHLKMVHQAIGEGIDVRGYFHWSLIDNFEWAQGYSSRFGLVHVDFKTQRRSIKGSGRLYAGIAAANAIPAAVLKKFPGDIYRPAFK